MSVYGEFARSRFEAADPAERKRLSEELARAASDRLVGRLGELFEEEVRLLRLAGHDLEPEMPWADGEFSWIDQSGDGETKLRFAFDLITSVGFRDRLGGGCSFRYSRFDPRLRTEVGWPEGTWTALSDLLKTSASPADALAVYLPVEDRYVEAAALVFAGEREVEVRRFKPPSSPVDEARLGPLPEGLPARTPGVVPPREAGPLLRACLREQMWCEFRTASTKLAVGHDLYVHVVAGRLCAEVRRDIEALGLFTQDFEYGLDPEPGLYVVGP